LDAVEVNHIQMSDIISELEPLFNPKSVSLVGASKDPFSWGARIFAHLVMGSYEGKIYPVNPNEDRIFGYDSYKKVPNSDLAVISVRAQLVPGVMEECAGAGVRAAVIVTSGFKESGADGAKLEEETTRIARKSGIRFVGPNCMGVLSTTCSLTVSITPAFAPKGNISIISQSGTTGNVIVETLAPRGIGFSKYVSSGNEADLHFEDYLGYLAQDDETKVILGFIEGVRDGKKFLRVCRSLDKPFAVVKAGWTSMGKHAAASHTGSLAGADEVYDAIFRQTNVVRVHTIGELMDVGAALSVQPQPNGNRLAVVTSGGGAGVMAADSCEEHGVVLAELSKDTLGKLDKILPPFWSHRNPVDMTTAAIGDITMQTRVIRTLMECGEVDRIILIAALGMLTVNRARYEGRTFPEEMKNIIPRTDAVVALEEALARQVVNMVKKYQKPVFSINPSVMLSTIDPYVAKIVRILSQGGVVSCVSPDDAIKAFRRAVEYKKRKSIES